MHTKDQHRDSTSLFNQHFKDSDYSIITIESKGKEHICLVDTEDYNLVNRYHWNLQSKGYAVTTINGKATLMHRLIMGVDNPAIQVDHIRHNKLDNRKVMLRLCTAAENRRNSLKHMAATSQFKGIYNDNGVWHVQIYISGKVKNKGRFRCERAAARVYDQFAKIHFKEFALLNFSTFSYSEQLAIPGFL